ncbi:MAG: hypothetical protein JSW46_17085 [Gemmatimonadota bacterium]|nr:MAG: hypothetical protein JSW46_17085 [Gemmatimonadota bacterium]
MQNDPCRDFQTRDATDGVVLTVEDFNHLVQWTECLYEWGRRVRNDIIELEERVGKSGGDPEDPPLPPWRKKLD